MYNIFPPSETISRELDIRIYDEVKTRLSYIAKNRSFPIAHGKDDAQ